MALFFLPPAHTFLPNSHASTTHHIHLEESWTQALLKGQKLHVTAAEVMRLEHPVHIALALAASASAPPLVAFVYVPCGPRGLPADAEDDASRPPVCMNGAITLLDSYIGADVRLLFVAEWAPARGTTKPVGRLHWLSLDPLLSADGRTPAPLARGEAVSHSLLPYAHADSITCFEQSCRSAGGGDEPGTLSDLVLFTGSRDGAIKGWQWDEARRNFCVVLRFEGHVRGAYYAVGRGPPRPSYAALARLEPSCCAGRSLARRIRSARWQLPLCMHISFSCPSSLAPICLLAPSAVAACLPCRRDGAVLSRGVG